MPDLTGPRFEPQTSRSRDKCVNARPDSRNVYCFVEPNLFYVGVTHTLQTVKKLLQKIAIISN